MRKQCIFSLPALTGLKIDQVAMAVNNSSLQKQDDLRMTS